MGGAVADVISISYQQRNLLVAGVAMGFALVLLLFTVVVNTIAEMVRQRLRYSQQEIQG